MINPTIYLAFELARRGQEARDEAAVERRAIASAARPSRPRFAGLRRAFRRDWAAPDLGPSLRDPYPTAGR